MTNVPIGLIPRPLFTVIQHLTRIRVVVMGDALAFAVVTRSTDGIHACYLIKQEQLGLLTSAYRCMITKRVTDYNQLTQ